MGHSSSSSSFSSSSSSSPTMTGAGAGRGQSRDSTSGHWDSRNLENIEHLKGMGFEHDVALFALRETGGDVNAAVNLLLSSSSNGAPVASTNSNSTSAANYTGNSSGTNDPRQRAAEAAMRREEQRKQQWRKGTGKGKGKGNASYPSSSSAPSNSTASSASASNSTEALASRLTTLGENLAAFPEAVDTLLLVLTTILQNPNQGPGNQNQKYRELKTTKKKYKETIGKSGRLGSEFLELLGFELAGEWYVLRREDSGALWLASDVLRNVQQKSSVYRQNKESLEFFKVLEASQTSATEEELERRRKIASSLPPEPEEGAAGTTRITVTIGSQRLFRKFFADDSFATVINWLGSQHSSSIVDKIKAGDWVLIDQTYFETRTLRWDDCDGKTLQGNQLWPSAELALKPADSADDAHHR